ncbi:hypothetical protein L1049_019882 [Liquidambar formosana]|uniref:Serine protease n=1 Tax=Liquidambar formosana TaxID=63359 RepID=A0AAP0S6K0_LIQFO
MDELIPVCVGNSADLRVGHEAYAFEHLFGYDYSFATGIISGAPRVINSVNTGRPMQDIIQTDAAINPGNSGALFDRSGNFIGMITSFRTCHGDFCRFNFAIPVDKLRRIFDDYVKQNVGTNLATDQYVE